MHTIKHEYPVFIIHTRLQPNFLNVGFEGEVVINMEQTWSTIAPFYIGAMSTQHIYVLD